MCTAITYRPGEHYFGRNLDLSYSYHETVTVMPRSFCLNFRHKEVVIRHYALIGMAFVTDDGNYPLYYDAVNEHGLAMAGLNFPGNAVWRPFDPQKDNISPFELIPWLLCQCRNLQDAKALLTKINLLDEPFSANLPLSPLHFILADKENSLILECMADGIHIYDDNFGILTNNPPYPFHLSNLALYGNLTSKESENRAFSSVNPQKYCAGMGAFGLPGDWSSPSRFVRAAFLRDNAISDGTEEDCVSQFFHILHGVEMVRGAVRLENGENDITIYTSCINQDRGIYYYTTYADKTIRAINMHNCDLDGDTLTLFPLEKQTILMQN